MDGDSNKSSDLFDPAFYEECFKSAVIHRKKTDSNLGSELWRACIEEYGELSRLFERSQIQESTAVRNLLRVRWLSHLLIDDEGDLSLDKLVEAIQLWERHLYSLAPERQWDSVRNEHILRVLCILRDDKESRRLLRKIGKPYANKVADQIIRDTLQLSSNAVIGDAQARRAALSAWLCYLRQNVGSCFATAPAIIIQGEKPHSFLCDLDELLTTGRLKRTFGGIEYSAPLSGSWGAGDLKRPVLVPRREQQGKQELWLSPALLEALTVVGIFDKQTSIRARLLQLRSWLSNLFQRWREPGDFFYVTAEAIIRQTLLSRLNLSDGDLEDYEQRSRPIVQGSLLASVPQSASGSGGKGEICARYLLLFAEACKTFKQFTENALLKSWEYTLASFAETKATFSKWNFYSSLGLNPDDVGGVGPAIYKAVEQLLQDLNSDVHHYQEEYDRMYGIVRHLEVRTRNVSSEHEGQWLRSELTSAVTQFRSFQQMRDAAQEKAKNVAGLYQLLVECYNAAFPRYFQEVYDADLHEVDLGPYDDSPAGFRLVYKYGRSNSSQWSAIHDVHEFVEALVNFFVATETEFSSSETFDGVQDLLTRIVSDIIAQVRSKEFLESALQRMAATHGVHLIANPLDHLDKVEKKPWVYTSGGSMDSLISSYCGLEESPVSVTRWMENPIELAVFLIDSLKQIPHQEVEQWRKEKHTSLLMHSPTHAFVCKPLFPLLQLAIATDAFTYTWVRDTIVIPMQRFVANIVLGEEKMSYLIDLLIKEVPDNYKMRFKDLFRRVYGTMDPMQFREYLVSSIESDRGLQRGGYSVLSADLIDSILYEQLPIISASQLLESVSALIAEIPEIEAVTGKAMIKTLEGLIPSQILETVIGAKKLQNIFKALLCLIRKETSSGKDYHKLVAHAAQKLGLAMPTPLLFADTNWPKDYFAITVNPGTGRFELWRMDKLGSSGSPMSSWNHWLDGSRQKPTWGIYTRPHQYYGSSTKSH